MNKPKYQNTYIVSYRLKPYPWTEGQSIFMAKPQEKSKVLQANSSSHAKERFYEYNPKTFFDYGEYKITKVIKK